MLPGLSSPAYLAAHGGDQPIIWLYSILPQITSRVSGSFKVRNRDLFPIHDSVKKLIESFEKFTITHVPRELNKLADAAVNRAMDEALGIEHPPHIAEPGQSTE